MKPSNSRGVYRFYAMQLLLIIVVSTIIFAISGRFMALSVLLGGLVALIPSVVFARMLFRYKGARAAKAIVHSFYLGEAFKLGLNFLLFALVFILYKVNPLAFFLTYIAVVMTHWFAPLIIVNQTNGPDSD